MKLGKTFKKNCSKKITLKNIYISKSACRDKKFQKRKKK